MELREVIEKRRAYRSFESVKIDDKIVEDLAYYASLAPSCFNNQPWRFVFVYEREKLNELKEALSSGNAWAKDSSMIIAVLSKPDYDCVLKDRKYYQFDTGMATGFLILRATDLGLVAHPIAGYNPEKVREVLSIPSDIEIITLIIVGKHSSEIKPSLNENQAKVELKRPQRKSFEEFSFKNVYSN